MSRYEPPSVWATDLERRAYDGREIEHMHRHPDLAWALGQRISHFTVEFLNSNPIKPHVIFNVNLNNQLPSGQQHEGAINAARISIESRETDNSNAGVCEIKLCNYLTQTHIASAGFEFRVKSPFTLKDFTDLIIGWPNMRMFHFCEVRGGVLDGCRDGVTQAFIRAYKAGYVEWEILGITGPDDNISRPVDEYERFSIQPERGATTIDWSRGQDGRPGLRAGFHDVTGNSLRTIVYHDLPLENGRFWAEGFSRVVRVDGVVLPYRDLSKAGTGLGRTPSPSSSLASSPAYSSPRSASSTPGSSRYAPGPSRGAAPPPSRGTPPT